MDLTIGKEFLYVLGFIGGIIFYFLQRATTDDVINFKNEVLVVLKKFKK